MTQHEVTRPTWCDKCGHVIPKGKLYYINNHKLLCAKCWKSINTGLQPYSVKQNNP